MTQQEFVKKESKRIIEEDWKDPSSPEDFVSMVLAKGLDIAKEFALWHSKLMYTNGVLRIIERRTTDELLTIFLTEKYGQ